MKRILFALFVFSLLILSGCGGGNKDITGDVVKDTGEKTQIIEKEPIKQPIPEPKEIMPEKEKVKSATLSVDRVQIQLANLYPIRVSVTNTGDLTIYPKFDVYVYDNNKNEVCSGSPLIDEFDGISSGSKKTGEFTILGCMFNKDGAYTLKVDLLDSDYNTLDTKSKEFTVDYWNKFKIDMDGLEKQAQEDVEKLMNQCSSPFVCTSSCSDYMDVGQKNCSSGEVCCLQS